MAKSKVSSDKESFLAHFFGEHSGYRLDITLKLLDDLDAFRQRLYELNAHGLTYEERCVAIKGIDDERQMYYAKIGEYLVDEYRKEVRRNSR